MAKYNAVRIIGRGGFGVVEEVQDTEGQLCARKTFEPAPYIPDTAYARLRKRFRREVRIQAELGGAEIMPVLDYDLNGKRPWFVMPLAEKIYEQQIVEDRASGSVDIDAIADTLNGLERLHELGYVHRDLNPKNVLRHESHWKLSDLGAVLPPTGHTVTLTEGTVIYTEQYCAPEQRNDFHSAKPPADVYSFGCMLHDIFGTLPRIPYRKQTAEGPIGLIIEKCTEVNPLRRPTVKVLRGMVIETLVEIGGHCKVADERTGEWLDRLSSIDQWKEDDFGEFARFFAQLDIEERSSGHDDEWVYSLSTPFLTRMPAEALTRIVERNDGVSAAIIEKYCEWARTTAFLFHFADTVCTRLVAIFDSGDPAAKAIAMVALIQLAESHNRWYVMRRALARCRSDELKPELGRRIAIEIKTEELEDSFLRCVSEVDWDVATLAPDLAKLCE